MTTSRLTRGSAVVVTVAALGSAVLAAAPAASAAPATATVTATARSDFGYLAGINRSGGSTYLRFDRAVMLTGAAARAAKAAHGLDPNDAPDYYIQNDSHRIRVLRVSGAVKVFGSQRLTGSPSAKPIPFAALRTYLATHPSAQRPPFALTYDSRGVVTRIAEVYLA